MKRIGIITLPLNTNYGGIIQAYALQSVLKKMGLNPCVLDTPRYPYSQNLSIYLKTKFARYLHGVAKISQHGTAKTYRFVPLQDFTEHSDIDWSKSIAEIDQQLYRKYNLSDDEIAFIEKMIKPME